MLVARLSADGEVESLTQSGSSDEDRGRAVAVGDGVVYVSGSSTGDLDGNISAGDHDLLTAWRRLTTSDHVYYMCTKYFADGEVHKYFNPYDSPYDAYINFVNVLDYLRLRVD